MANLDDLKEKWQSESGISQERFDEIGDKVTDGTTKFHSAIFKRDMVESLASLLVLIGGSVMLFFAKGWIDWLGYLSLVVAGILIPYKLWRAHPRTITSASASNFRDFIGDEVDYLHGQIKLLRNVFWWYLLPIIVATTLVSIGVAGPKYDQLDLIILTLLFLFYAAIYGWCWWINQRACRVYLTPLLKYYEGLRDALNSEQEIAMDLSGPPLDFLNTKSRTISETQRRTGIVLTLFLTVAWTIAAIAIMNKFDQRTGRFIMYSTPVVTILAGFVTGIHRKNDAEETE